MSEGKTVARIETEPVDPEYGGVDRGALLIHFTDGTALRIEGYSYDEVDLGLEELSAEELRQRAVQVEAREAEAREQERRRAEWLALSCDERAKRRAAAEAALSPATRAMRSIMDGVATDYLAAAHRQVYGGPETVVRLPCERCGERQCENAPTRTLPETATTFSWGEAKFPVRVEVEGGSLKPD